MSVADTITLDWENNEADGDELVEIFRRLTTGPGPWTKVKTLLVNGAPTQSTTVEVPTPLTEYDFAIRGQRGGLYRSGWGSANPDLWDDVGLETGAKALAVASGAVAPVISNCAWYRLDAVTHRIGLNWAAGPSGATVQVHRATVEGGPYTLIDTTAADATDYQDSFVNGAAGVRYYYKTRFKRGSLLGDFSEISSAWAGPLAPTLTSFYFSNRGSVIGETYDEWGVTWTWPSGDFQGVQTVIVQTDIVGDGSWVTQGPTYYDALGDAVANPDRPGDVFGFVHVALDYYCIDPATFDVRLRTKQTAFGVDNYSEYSSLSNEPGCEPA